MHEFLMFFIKPTIFALIIASSQIIAATMFAYIGKDLNEPIPKRLKQVFFALTSFTFIIVCLLQLL